MPRTRAVARYRGYRDTGSGALTEIGSVAVPGAVGGEGIAVS
jgi:hypothetical protein